MKQELLSCFPSVEKSYDILKHCLLFQLANYILLSESNNNQSFLFEYLLG